MRLKRSNLLLGLLLLANFSLSVIFLSACMAPKSSLEPKGPVPITSVRPKAPETEVMEVLISRSTLRAALKSPESSRLRLIELLKSAEAASSDSTVPEYRLFDVLPGGAASLVGLQPTDILIAAHGFVIFSPVQFFRYLSRLQVEKEGNIEIRRENRPMILSLRIVDP